MGGAVVTTDVKAGGVLAGMVHAVDAKGRVADA